MKCECKACDGTGEITVDCEECDGEGKLDICISKMSKKGLGLGLGSDDRDTLTQFQKDAIRCQEQAKRLSEMNPSCAESYAGQLAATLTKLNHEAEEFLKDL